MTHADYFCIKCWLAPRDRSIEKKPIVSPPICQKEQEPPHNTRIPRDTLEDLAVYKGDGVELLINMPAQCFLILYSSSFLAISKLLATDLSIHMKLASD